MIFLFHSAPAFMQRDTRVVCRSEGNLICYTFLAKSKQRFAYNLFNVLQLSLHTFARFINSAAKACNNSPFSKLPVTKISALQLQEFKLPN